MLEEKTIQNMIYEIRGKQVILDSEKFITKCNKKIVCYKNRKIVNKRLMKLYV